MNQRVMTVQHTTEKIDLMIIFYRLTINYV